MSDVIDDLKVQIDASTNNADAKIEKFIHKMMQLQSAIIGVEMSGASQVASGINQISAAIQGFSERTKTTDFNRIATGLNKISSTNIQGVSNVAHAMETFSNSMAKMGTMNLDTQKIADVANSISKLGRTSVTEATRNLEFLKTSLANFISGMNSVGSLNFNPDSLYRLVSSISKLGGTNATQAVQNLPQISTYLREFITSMNAAGSVTFSFDGLNSLVNSIARLGGAKATQAAANLKPLKDQILRFVSGLNGIGTLNFDTAGLANLVSSITKLGGKAATTSIPNIQQLGVALTQLISTLSHAPAVSQNLIQIVNALANLASNGARVSSASSSMTNGLNMYSYSARRATKSTKGLVSQIGMFYAKCFLWIRAFKALGRAIASSMDYIETLNYFDAAWRQVATNAVGQWKESGYESAEAYANSFSTRAKELTGKLTGFQPDENGNLISTKMPSLGLDPEKTMDYQATFGQMASSMGIASETALKLSQALTEIGADLASVKNLKFEDVWQDMASGMVGMSRTLDKYGVNIRNVNMQEKLYELGIDAKVSKLNQYDKALLRVIILLQSTKYAWGDMANTIGQPANQLRLLQANFANLARTIGGLFLPIVTKVLPYINALVIALQRLFSWIGGLLGIKIGGFSSSVGSAATDFGDMEDAADGIADSTGDAAKNTKKMADNLQGFDKLNTVGSGNDSGGSGGAGGGAGAGGLLDDAFMDAYAEYQAAWDAAFANMENSAQKMADEIEKTFNRIWQAAEPTRESLKRLWNEGLSQLGNFTWTALRDFWNEFLVPLGNWSLGTGFPMLIDAVNNFLTAINWTDINDALRNFWQSLEPFTEKVGEGLIEFFDDLLQFGAGFINFTVPNGLNSLAEALKKISPQTAKDIGYGLGILATSLVAFKNIKIIAAGIGTLSSNFGKFFKVAGVAKYGAIALGIGGVVVALDKFGYIDVNWNTLVSAFKKLATVLGKFASGIGKGLISFVNGFLDVMSPALEGLVNGFAVALDGFGTILNSIPESVISGLTEVLISFFTAFLTYKAVIVVGGLISTLVTILKSFAGAVSRCVNSGTILSNLALSLGPAALGGIAFTVIGGGLLLIAQKIAQVTEEAAKNSSLGQFSQAIEELNDEVSQKSSQIQNSLANTKHDLESVGVAETQMARDLATEYEMLSSKTNLTASEQEKLRDVSGQLVELVPGLSKYIDEQTGVLNTQNKTLEDLIKNQELYAKQQAASSLMEEAYKQQYEATYNLKHAQDGYNKAVETYLENAGLAPSVLEEIKDGTLDVDAVMREVSSHPYLISQKYGIEGGRDVLQKALEGLNEVVREHKVVLDEAFEAESKADQNLEDVQSTLKTTTKDLEENSQEMINNQKNTSEFQQALSDLKGEFSDLGITISEEFLDKLAFDDTGLADDVIIMFDTLKNQTEMSGEEIKQMFGRLGYDIPKEFANVLSQQSSEVRTQFATLFSDLSAGVPAEAEQLNLALQTLGYSLPNTLVKALASKSPSVQAKTIELLGKIEGGKKLAEGNLIEVFQNLGLDVPNALIGSLTSDEVTAGTQKSAIDLLGKIKEASDSERQPLINEYNKLGVGIIDEGIVKALTSGQTPTKNAAVELIKVAALGAIEESKRTGKGSVAEAGNNFLKGYLDELTSDTAKGLLRGAGINMAQTVIKGIQEGQDSHSPSKETAKLGGDALDGYINRITSTKTKNSLFGAGIQIANNLLGGLQEGQDLIPRTISEFAGNISRAFNMSNPIRPEIGVTYSVNEEILRAVDTRQTVDYNFGTSDFKATISSELKGALSDIIDYDRLANVLVEKLERANITAELDSDKAYNNVKNKWRQDVNRTGKTPVPIV